MNYNQKRHFHIGIEASTAQVCTLLDAVQSDNKDEIDELMNDFDTEFIAPEEIKLTGNPSNGGSLRLQANANVVDQGTTHTKELETDKKRKKTQKNSTPITCKCNVSPHSREYCLLEGRVANQFDESVQILMLVNKLLMLMF